MYGERIREKREEFGLTREELATRLAILPQHLKLWEEEKVAPSIPDLIILAGEFSTTIDWLVGAVQDELDEDLTDEEHHCESCEEFIECKLLPHMHNYMDNNDDAAYIHIQLALEGEGDDCVIYTGSTTGILASLNLLLKNISSECKTDYYDLVALMASVYAKSEMGGFFEEDE